MKPRAQGVGYGMGVGWLLVLLGAQPAAAAPCHVPSSNYPTIQAAVNDATCDAINVAAGTFTEHVTIDRDVTMRGEGEDRTIVDGSSSGTVVTITSGTVTIKGVTIQNGSAAAPLGGGGIRNDGTLTIQDSTISSNRTGGPRASGGGIVNIGTLTIQDSTISGNFAFRGGGGISTTGTLTIQDSTIENNIPNDCTGTGCP